MSKKISQRTRDNFLFYLRNRHRLTFSGAPSMVLARDAEGASSLEWFAAFDSRGVKLQCRHPKTVSAVLATKGAINFQVKQWREGQSDVLLLADEMLACFSRPPAWIEKIVNKIAFWPEGRP